MNGTLVEVIYCLTHDMNLSGMQITTLKLNRNPYYRESWAFIMSTFSVHLAGPRSL